MYERMQSLFLSLPLTLPFPQPSTGVEEEKTLGDVVEEKMTATSHAVEKATEKIQVAGEGRDEGDGG